MRNFLRVRKLINGALCIGHIVVDDFGETGQVRIFLVEHLKDFLGVDVVLCKDDGFAQFAAIVDGQAVGHQCVQHLPDGIFIENPLVQRRRCNALRKFTILVLKSVLVGPLVRVGKFIVDNALFNEFQFRFYRQEIHQIPVLDRLRQLIAIGGHAIFQLKYLIGILVDLVLGRGCQPHQRGIKVVENIPVFVVNGAVSFVADDQIEMPAGEEFALLVLYTVDGVVHGLIGGKYAVRCVVILLLAEIGNGEIGQQIHKAALGLRYQTVAVSKEENIFHPTMLKHVFFPSFTKRAFPTMLKQHIAQGNDRPRLAGAGGHDQQRLAPVACKGIADSLDRALLIVATSDLAVDHDIFEACPHGLEIEQFFQIPLGVDSGTLAFGIDIVRNAGLKAIGQENDRAAVILLFQQVCIELCLLASLGHIHACALSLHHCQRAAIIAVEHIVRITHLGLVWHTGQFYLIQPVLPLYPSGVGEHGVDVKFPGLVFGQIQRLRHIGLLLLSSAGGELFLQSGILRHKGCKIYIGYRLRRNCGRFGGLHQQGTVKVPLCVVLTIAIGHEVQEYIEVFQTQRRLLLGDFPAGMGGMVAKLPDEFHSAPDILTNDVLKVLAVHQRNEPVVVGQTQRIVNRVHPLDRKLHRPPAVQHAGRRVNM